MNKTIVSISTPLGKGAISIVRMSGDNSLKIAQSFFSSKKLDYDKIQPNYLYLGHFNFNDKCSEKCFMVYFKSPFSYTGDDMVEFQVHGGTILTQKIVDSLINNGASLAQPGEFSQIAFENGKISLDEAEAIIGEINAESESELKANLNLADGKLKQKIIDLQNELTSQIAQIEATLDYPEEDFEKSVKESIFNSINDIKKQLSFFIEQSNNLKYINHGVNVSIVGSPNVGKSSLLNALIGEEKAIVTDIAGTTRDIVNEYSYYKGIKFNFIDTAGIRDSNDTVEKIGIEKSQKSILLADIVLCLIDGSRKIDEYDEKIINLVKDKKHIIVVNKIDCERKSQKFEDEIEISAKDEINIELLKEKIYNMVIDSSIDFNKMMVVNQRQSEILKSAEEITIEILNNKEESMDIISMLIKKLWNCLGKITGECENESIIDLIFSKFCLGK